MWSRAFRNRAAVHCTGAVDSHFRKVHAESQDRPCGGPSSIPPMFDAPVLYAKDSSTEEILYKNANAAYKLLQIHADTRDFDKQIKEKMPDHIKTVQGHWNAGLFVRLAQLAGHPDPHLEENMTFGHPTSGQIQRSLVWTPRDDADKLLEEVEKESKYRAGKPIIRKTPPGFAHPKDLDRLWKETEEMVQAGWLEPIDEPKSCPIYGFPVLQGEIVKEHPCGWTEFAKARHCFDFRQRNGRCPEVERMRLLSNRTVIEILSRMLSKGHKARAPLMQIKRDVSADLDLETRLRDNTQNDIEAAQKVEAGKIWDPASPGICKRDFRKW